jgi:hypothetical protein
MVKIGHFLLRMDMDGIVYDTMNGKPMIKINGLNQENIMIT